MEPTIVALVGQRRSGKTTSHAAFKQYGYTTIILSNFIAEEARKEDPSLTAEVPRETLIVTGKKLREQYGNAVIIERALTQVREKQLSRILIDGVRYEEEVVALKRAGAFLVGVVRPEEARNEAIKLSSRKEPQSATGQQLMSEEDVE